MDFGAEKKSIRVTAIKKTVLDEDGFAFEKNGRLDYSACVIFSTV